MRLRTLLAILLVAGTAVWVGGALNWAEWAALFALGFVALLGLSLASMAGRADREMERQYRERDDDWPWPVDLGVDREPREDSSSLRHPGLDR